MSAVPITPEVQEHAIALMSAILARLDQMPAEGGKLVLGTCSDGLVLLFPVVDLTGAKRMNLIRVTEEDILNTGSDILWNFYMGNREGKQTIEDFALTFKAGWNDSAGIPLN